MVKTHWWLRSYSSQALERYKLKAVFISNLFWAAFCSELQFLVCLKIFILNLLSCNMPGRPMTEEQKRKKRERERERQNGTPVIA